MKRFLATAILSILPQAALAGTAAVDVPEETRAAVATIDGFLAALSSGDLDLAATALDPDVIILESGGAEHSAAEYFAHHAKADADFLKSARRSLKRRTARAAASLVWVATESELEAWQDEKPLVVASTETMVLRSAGDGWKIVHIHWSSHAKSR